MRKGSSSALVHVDHVSFFWFASAYIAPTCAIINLCLSDAECCSAIKRRLDLPLARSGGVFGHEKLTSGRARVRAHDSFRDSLLAQLRWLGGLRVDNLNKPGADLESTPFARQPDLSVEEPGLAPTSRWWSVGANSSSAA